VDDDHSLLDSIVTGDETLCLWYDPLNKITKHGMLLAKLSKKCTHTKSFSKVKKQSDVGHILSIWALLIKNLFH
jgi:hypothetical protein